MKGSPVPDEVSDHVYKAEALLALAGEPETRNEMLITAQTEAILALVKAMRPSKVDTYFYAQGLASAPITPLQMLPIPPNSYVARVPARIIPAGGNVQAQDVSAACTEMAKRVPDWDIKKIVAIKEIRSITNMGLKEAKEVVDAMAACAPGFEWWT